MELATRLIEPSPTGEKNPLRGLYDSQYPTISLQEAIALTKDPLALALFNQHHPNFTHLATSDPNHLTPDEIGSIFIYTAELNFYAHLNQLLRESKRGQLTKTYFPYLRLFIGALEKLPDYKGNIYRGVKKDLGGEYPVGKRFYWYSISSCTVSLSVLEDEKFCGVSGSRTLFFISAVRGKVVAHYSNYREEEEVVLLPGTLLEVTTKMVIGGGLCIVSLHEVSEEGMEDGKDGKKKEKDGKKEDGDKKGKKGFFRKKEKGKEEGKEEGKKDKDEKDDKKNKEKDKDEEKKKKDEEKKKKDEEKKKKDEEKKEKDEEKKKKDEEKKKKEEEKKKAKETKQEDSKKPKK